MSRTAVSRMHRQHSVHGLPWTLCIERHVPDLYLGYQPASSLQFEHLEAWLDDIWITGNEQATKLLERRQSFRSPEFSCTREGYIKVSNIELTPEEVELIRGGVDPYDLLFGELPDFVVTVDYRLDYR